MGESYTQNTEWKKLIIIECILHDSICLKFKIKGNIFFFDVQLGSKCMEIIILVSPRKKGGSYDEEKRNLRISKERIMFHFLISVAIKQILSFTFMLYEFKCFFIFHNTKCAPMEICPLYIAEWKKVNYRSIYIVWVKENCVYYLFIHIFICLENLKGKRSGFLFYLTHLCIVYIFL